MCIRDSIYSSEEENNFLLEDVKKIYENSDHQGILKADGSAGNAYVVKAVSYTHLQAVVCYISEKRMKSSKFTVKKKKRKNWYFLHLREKQDIFLKKSLQILRNHRMRYM